jgi:uncharacterized membrane protein SpoIIM required for sporulation
MVFLLVMITMPLMYFTLRHEEKSDWNTKKDEKTLFKEHAKTVKFLVFLFIGFVIGFALFFVFLPQATVQELFKVQVQTISNINNGISGQVFGMDTFYNLLINNLKVLFFCIVFALFFGAGAIFILAWNASVIGVAVGLFFRNAVAESAKLFGFFDLAVYFHVFVFGIFRYLIHGVFEIAAYFFGALAGGIISMSIIRHDIANVGFKKVLIDTSLMLIIAIILLLLGALVEVFFTPLLY